MGSTGGKWNPEPESESTPGDALADLMGVLADPEIRARLSDVVAKLAAIRERGDVRRKPTPQRVRSRRPGWMQTAVLTILAEREAPMQVGEIKTAVEALIGEPVSKSSVNGVLSGNARERSSVVRVAKGVYRLADRSAREA